ncbi:MAG: hypothetical protein JWQ35_219 [Bacteriovoracaceae bacterium]|nr:hypothetical protein [Bacteriovoracaceae bacterium]
MGTALIKKNLGVLTSFIRGHQDTALVMAIGLLKLLFLIIFFTFCENMLWARHIHVDVWGWRDFFNNCLEGLTPYVDFSKEYPHLAGYFFWGLSKIFTHANEYFLEFHAGLMWVLDLANTWLFIQILRFHQIKRIWVALLLFQFNLTYLLLGPFRFESLLLIFILGGYLAQLRSRPLIATFIWSLGFHIKWVPAFFIAVRDVRLFFTEKKRKTALYSMLIFILVTVFIFGGAILFDELKNGNMELALNPYWFHIHRPIYWDTLIGVIVLWWGYMPWEKWLSIGSLLLMTVFIFYPRKMSFERKVVLICAAALIFNRVYSTQFHMWFYPFFIILMLRPEMKKYFASGLALFISLDLLNIIVYPFSFTQILLEIGEFNEYTARLGGVGTWIFSGAIVLRAILIGVLMHWIFTTQFDENSEIRKTI